MSDSTTAAPPSSSSPVRFVILIGLLGVMLGALWYDRKVARPAVEDAYNRIAKLNGEMNSKAGHTFMTNKDVQSELKRTPIEILRQDGYLIEVYGWRAGLPTRTHNYYAVYSVPVSPGPDGRWGKSGVDDDQDSKTDEEDEAGAAGSDDVETTPVFLKHYMNYLDKEELKTMPTIVPPDINLTDVLTGDVQPSAPGKGPSGQSRRRSKEESGDDKSVLKSDDKSDEPKAEDKKADDKKESDTKEDAKKEDNKAGEKNEAEQKDAEKKESDKKEPEKKDSEKKDPETEPKG